MGKGKVIYERKHWIKVWTEEWLTGTIRQELTSAQRGIWIDLLVMAGRSRTLGIVQANEETAYTHRRLGQIIGIGLEELEVSLDLFTRQGRISENGAGIKIINWAKYQTGKGA